MGCFPTPLSPSASDSPSQCDTSDPALVAPRVNGHRPVQSYQDPAADRLAPVTSHDLFQSFASNNLLPGAPYEHHVVLSRLPAEVLDEIFSYAKFPTLARLVLVCRTFQGVATRLLYRHVPSLSLSRTTCCLETLASNPRRGLLSPSFYRLLQSALHNMYRLTDLTLLLNGPTSHVLLGAPFRLTKLTASCDFDATMACWLTEQTNLRSAIFCGNFTTGVTLPSDALPSLQRIAAAPLTLACIVPGRPIREVELCLVHPWSLNREVLQTTIRIIAFTKGPLDSLKIISHLAEPPETGSITDDILSGLPPILAQFSGLKSLTLFSKNRTDALHAAAGTRTLVTAWHTTCTSLESVTLVGSTYVHNPAIGWHRATEPCKREAALDNSRPGHGLTPELGSEREGGASVVAIAA
ncbi:hypothetical protein BC826DRAFT_984931 [Russula brevipes]|nr:hypothetical protein BC826DRAFT_984931 [Russula brevipes]